MVELYAGDTFPFTPAEVATKVKREAASLKKVLRLLPPDVRREFGALGPKYVTNKSI